MSLHWYACNSTNTCCFEMHHILLETNWWALPNTSSIVWICSAVHEILANKAFTATDSLISQLFVVAFVHSTYMWITLIWGFLVQLSLWKSVHWLWKYKLNEVCDRAEHTAQKARRKAETKAREKAKRYVICKSTCLENYILTVISSPNYTSLPSMVEILLFDLVFHDRVTSVSVSTLKPLLGVIGALSLKPWTSPILSVCI